MLHINTKQIQQYSTQACLNFIKIIIIMSIAENFSSSKEQSLGSDRHETINQ